MCICVCVLEGMREEREGGGHSVLRAVLLSQSELAKIASHSPRGAPSSKLMCLSKMFSTMRIKYGHHALSLRRSKRLGFLCLSSKLT